jgi:diguanylate cyclase (GGDEF)-like protein
VPETTFDEGGESADLRETWPRHPAADLSRTPVAVLDEHLTIVYANAAFERLAIDLGRDDILLSVADHQVGASLTSTADVAEAVRSGQAFAGEWRRMADRAKWMPAVIEPVPGHEGHQSVVSILDLDQWNLDGRPLTAGQLDAVTGLCTRESFLRVLERVCADDRSTRGSLGLVFADLDAFKEINDRHGHLTGDRALASVARTLAEAVRPDDLVARFGGDEFVVLCRNLGPLDCAGLAVRIHAAIELTELSIGGLSASLGIAVGTAPIHATSLLDAADQAMYRAKRQGKGRTEVTSVVANRSA